MTAMTSKVKRQTNVEAFRCLLMFFIILCHAYGCGPLADSESIWNGLFTLLLCWHVDGFIAITGWFGIKFSWAKFFRLYGVIVFYSVLSMAYTYWTGKGSYGITGGWFGNTYLLLMLVSPLLNLGIEKLSERPKREVLFVWGVFALGMALKYIPIVGVKPAGTGGFTITTFVFVYVTARLLHKAFADIGSWKHIVIGVGVFLVGAICLWLGIAALGFHRTGVFWPVGIERYPLYDSPHVWIMACSMLLLFVYHIRVPAWLGRCCCFMAPSMFAIYLLHNVTAFGRKIYCIPEAWMSGHTELHPILIVFTSAIMTFLICLAVDLLRRCAVWAIGCMLGKEW